MHIAERVSKAQASAVNQTLKKVKAAQEAHPELDLISMLRGEPDFPTPAHIIKATQQALEAGATHYPPNQGLPELREAVSTKMKKNNNIDCDPETEVLITTGATMGFNIALLATCEPGDTVLVPEPLYDVYVSQIGMAGAEARKIKAVRNGSRFTIPKESLNASMDKRTRGILVNTPWNPVGTVMTREEMMIIAHFAKEHDLTIYSDEIYETILYDDRAHHSFAALNDDARQRTITINSFSKSYAMTGWRVGYNVAPPDITHAMSLVYQQCSRGATTFVQHGALAALTQSQQCIEDMRNEYSARRDLIASFDIPGCTLLLPEAGFFVLLDVSGTGRTSAEVADRLLNECGLVTMDAVAYGSATDGLLRISFANSRENIEEAMKRITSWMEKHQ